jgi:hypothetical protein
MFTAKEQMFSTLQVAFLLVFCAASLEAAPIGGLGRSATKAAIGLLAFSPELTSGFIWPGHVNPPLVKDQNVEVNMPTAIVDGDMPSEKDFNQFCVLMAKSNPDAMIN